MTLFKSFEDVFNDVSGGNVKIPQSHYLSDGDYPIVDQGKALIAGYTNDESNLCLAGYPVIIFGDHTKCFKYIDFDFCMGADGVKVIQPKLEADTKFLYYYLKSLTLPDAGYSRHFKYLKRTNIYFPPLPEQKRIAAILDKAELLRAKRRQSLAKLDQLTQSIFLEMFGDPADIIKASNAIELNDVLVFITSGGRGWADYYSDNGQRFIRSFDVQMNYIGNKDVVFVSPPENAEARRTRIQAGDVLLTITGSRIGRVAAAEEELSGAYISQHVAILRLDQKKLIPEFLSLFLSLEAGGQRQIAKSQYGQTKPGLNFEQIKKFKIPSASMPLQLAFMSRIKRLQAVKAFQERSLTKLDALFATLQHQAFNGEL